MGISDWQHIVLFANNISIQCNLGCYKKKSQNFSNIYSFSFWLSGRIQLEKRAIISVFKAWYFHVYNADERCILKELRKSPMLSLCDIMYTQEHFFKCWSDVYSKCSMCILFLLQIKVLHNYQGFILFPLHCNKQRVLNSFRLTKDIPTNR